MGGGSEGRRAAESNDPSERIDTNHMPVTSQAQLEAIVGVAYHARMRASLLPLVTRELVAEHRAAPLGQHSDALQRVLNYFGSLPIDGKLIVEHDGDEHWFVSRLAGFPAVAAQRIAGPLPDEAAALHAVFERRLVEIFGIDSRRLMA